MPRFFLLLTGLLLLLSPHGQARLGAFIQFRDVDPRFQHLANEFQTLLTEKKTTSAREVLAEMQAMGNSEPSLEGKLHLLQALYWIEESKFEIATEQLQLARIVSERQRDSLTLGYALSRSAEVFEDRFGDSLATVNYLDALAIFNSIQDTFGLIRTHYELGTLRYNSGDQQAAQQSMEVALSLSIASQNWLACSTILNYKGLFYFKQGAYHKSIPYCLASLELYEWKGIKPDVVRTMNMLGSLLHRLGESEKGLGYFESSLAIARQENYPRQEANILNNIGSILADQQRYEEALEKHLVALGLYKGLNYSIGESASLNNISVCYENRGMFQLAINYQLEALKIDQQNGDPFGEAISFCNLGEYHRQLEQYETAHAYYLKSQAIATGLELVKLDPYLFNGLSITHKERGEFEKALEYRELYESTLQAEEQDSAVAMVLAYEGEKKDQKIEELASQTNRQSSWLSISLWIGGFFVLGSLAMLTLYIRRTRHQKSRLNHLKSKLSDQTHENQDLKANLTDLKKNLNLKTQHHWPTFLVEFELLYPEFIPALKKAHPSLTNTDLRLLSLIRLDLGTAEVANFLLITQAGVKKVRQRVRKKLSSASSQSLQEYLNQF